MTWNDPTQRSGPTPDDGASDAPWPADGLDRLIADAARDYHTPPAAVPREAMWAAIVAARPVGAPVVPVTGEHVVSLDAARSARAARIVRRRGLMAVAAAAAIFLATGVGIGRWWGRDGVVATRGQTPSVGGQTPSVGGQTPSVASLTPNAEGQTPNVASLTPNTPADRPVRVTKDDADRPSNRGVGSAANPYDVAVMRHFAQAEALLVSYRADTVDAAMDARLAKWARPLLGDTRLLLDSPAARDPRRRRLLEDLELVLAEVARLAPQSGRDSTAAAATTADPSGLSGEARTERQLIDGTLRRQQLLPRLRIAAPAGA